MDPFEASTRKCTYCEITIADDPVTLRILAKIGAGDRPPICAECAVDNKGTLGGVK